MTKREFYKVCKEMLNIVNSGGRADCYVTEMSEFFPRGEFPSGVYPEGEPIPHSVCQPLPTPNGNTLLLFHESILKLNKYEIFINILDSIVWIGLYKNGIGIIRNDRNNDDHWKWVSARRIVFDKYSKGSGLIFIFRNNTPIKIKKGNKIVWNYEESENKNLYKGFMESSCEIMKELDKENV